MNNFVTKTIESAITHLRREVEHTEARISHDELNLNGERKLLMQKREMLAAHEQALRPQALPAWAAPSTPAPAPVCATPGPALDAEHRRTKLASDVLVQVCHGASKVAGWWTGPQGLRVDELLRNPANGQTLLTPDFGRFVAGAIYAQKLMLTVSELAESMEGDRKSLPDDKLPQFPMRVVEIADAMIRAADLAGAVIPPDAGYTLGDVVAAKLAYNAKRADHKAENRAAAGGKAY